VNQGAKMKMTAVIQGFFILLILSASWSGLFDELCVCTAQAAETPTQYTCGMHPLVITEEPGLCPICHMVLTPLQDDEHGAEDERRLIQVDSVTVQRMGVRTAIAAPRTLTHNIRTFGRVAYAEPQQQAINTKLSGWVEALHIDETGKTVVKGDPLLDLYSPDLLAAQHELLLALRNRAAMADSGFAGALADAERLLDAARRRLQLWDIKPGQIQKLEETGEVQKTLTLYAPVSGVVSRKQVRVGEYISAGRELLEISSLSPLWVYADIYVSELPWVRVGQQALIEFPLLAQPITGTLSTIYPALEAKTRTVKARIDIDNPDLRLKPQMYAEVQIRTHSLEQALSVPLEAVLFSGTQERVFVDLGEGRFAPREVKVGLQDEEGYIEILSGVSAGEKVVTSAQFLLDSESKLREAVNKMRAADDANVDLDELF